MPNLILPANLTSVDRADVFAHVQAGAAARLERMTQDRAAGAGFDFPTQLIGKTPDGLATLYVDPALGSAGVTDAQAVLAGTPAILSANAGYFAPKTPAPAIEIVLAALGGRTDGTGGAYHYGCNYKIGGVIYVCYAAGDAGTMLALLEAEVSECSMGKQSKGWMCGQSNGEALSRLLAELVSGGPDGKLASFASGPAWDQAGRPNWIDATEPTDQSYPSIGCGMVYLYWMISLGHDAAKLAQAGCPKKKTLAANYAAITGKATAWADFKAAVDALPAGAISGDNPWGGNPS